jgi:hypothetical protein
MSFEVEKFDRDTAMVIPKQKLWLTEDRTQLVADGDPRAAFLFCIAGRPIPKSEAAKYGLLEEKPKPAEVKEAPKVEDKELPPAEDKAIAPAEDKAAEPPTTPQRTRRNR